MEAHKDLTSQNTNSKPQETSSDSASLLLSRRKKRRPKSGW